MDDLLLNIVKSQREDYLALQTSADTEVTRAAELPLKKLVTSPLIKVVIGPRRAGKSTLIRRVLQSTAHAYFSFEDERLPDKLDTDALLKALKTVWKNSEVFFFDEIQNLDNWEKFLHRLHAARKNIFVTGSNSKLLSKELSSNLTGRHHTITLLPFSWEEYVSIVPDPRPSDLNPLFTEYLTDGGFPDVVTKNAAAFNYLNQLYDSILMRDIVQRYRIRNIPALRALSEVLVRSVGSHVSGRSLQKAIPVKLNNTTIENYLRYFDEAFLVNLLQKFEPSLAKQKKADRKPYVFDTGFLRAISPSQVSESFGQLLENFVFLTLIRHGATPKIDLFYYQSSNKFEVDFLWFKKGDTPILIQSCWSIADHTTRQREFRALVEAARHFRVEKAWVVTASEERQYTEGELVIDVVTGQRFCEYLLSTPNQSKIKINP